MRPFAAVVAADEELGIGRDGDLAWHLPGDMRWFRDLTTGERSDGLQNTVIMGRKTWDSIPTRFRPLPGRYNVVVSRNPNLALPEGVGLAHSLDEGLSLASAGDIFVIGGGQLYAEAMRRPQCEVVYLTRVEGNFQCDTVIPDPNTWYTPVKRSPPMTDGGISYHVVTFQRKIQPPQG